MERRVTLSIVIAVLLVLGLSGGALATIYFPPIYDDYAADRDLDGAYSTGQLNDYLNDPEVDQYGDPTIVSDLDALVRAMLDDRSNPPPVAERPWRHATPQEIYDDYADDGHFDWNYYDADLQAYFDDPMIQQYGDPDTIAEIDALLTSLLADRGSDRDTFPLTGTRFALMILGAAGLAGVGLGLRRLA